MSNRLPLDTAEEGDQSDRHIGDKKYREKENIYDLSVPFTMNAFPLGNKRDKCHKEEQHVRLSDRSEDQGNKHVGILSVARGVADGNTDDIENYG